MKLLIKKLQLGENFEKAIQAIYSKQVASIEINNDLSKRINIQKGMHQGCPLSPLLLIMVLEVLLKGVQDDDELTGIKYKGYQYKYQAFAYDILFFMEDPQITIPKLTMKINEFGNLAGFYINKKKSKLLCKNMTKKQKGNLMEITQCEVTNKVKYLGINITANNIDLYKNNYEPMWKKMEEDLAKWKKLN